MSSKVTSVFRGLAERLAADADDLLLLEADGINTCDELFFRLPSAERLEEYLGQRVYGFRAERRDDDTLNTLAASRTETRATWLRGPGAASLRRLYEASKALAKKDLERLTEERIDGEAPRKVNAAVLADLGARAAARGLGPQLDTERPGPATLAKVIENFKLGGAFQYLQWEEFLSEEEEMRSKRLGLSRREVGFRVVPSEGGFKGIIAQDDERRQRVEDQVALEETLHIRAATHEYIEVAEFQTYSRLTMEYVRTFRRRAPECMRGPTLGELRLVDRLIHTDILTFVARGEGSLSEGLKWYLTEGRGHRVWDVLEPVLECTPDRGKERVHRALPDAGPSPSGNQGEKRKADDPPLCKVCGLPRSQHPNRSFCKPKKGKGKGAQPDSKAPPHMQGRALAVPGKNGVQFCWNFHRKDKGCKDPKCKRSHRCPNYKDGKVCMGRHAAFDCE